MKVIIRPGTALDVIAISAKKMSQSHLCKNEFETVVWPLASLTHPNLVPVNQSIAVCRANPVHAHRLLPI